MKVKTAGYRLIRSDCRRGIPLADKSVRMVVTSPPYWGLRDYGEPGQIGLEPTPEAYVARMVEVFRDVRRVLVDDGTVWLNLGDSYAGSWGNQGRKSTRGAQRPVNGPRMQNDEPYPMRTNTGKLPEGSGLKEKDLVGIPWMVAFALRADGWYLRSDIIWNKPNPMPESVEDRPTKSHEYLFLLSKRADYYYDHEAIREDATCSPRPDSSRWKAEGSKRSGQMSKSTGLGKNDPEAGRNKRSVWTVTLKPYKGAHFAVFPPDLIEPCIEAGSAAGDVVLDPFNGSGTSGEVSLRLGRRYVGLDLSAKYLRMATRRIERPHSKPERPERPEALPLFGDA